MLRLLRLLLRLPNFLRPRNVPEHVLKKLTLISAYCSCGWRFHQEFLKGKSDLFIEEETQEEFNKHKAVFDGKRPKKL